MKRAELFEASNKVRQIAAGPSEAGPKGSKTAFAFIDLQVLTAGRLLALDLHPFFPADARILQAIPFRHKYTLRFSVSGFNLTNHFNPLDVHANLSDSLYALFFGN